MLGRILLSLFLLWPSIGFAQWLGPPNVVLCNKIATFSNQSSITTIITAAAGKQIYLCGWEVTASVAGTFAFTFGTTTTTACDTAAVAITPTLNVSTNAVTDHGQYAFTSGAVGSGLCVTPSATTISGEVYYALVPTLGN